MKSALEACGWDAGQAAAELQRKGLSAAAKKASRVAAEGLVGVASSPAGVALAELNCETDFASRTPRFAARPRRTPSAPHLARVRI